MKCSLLLSGSIAMGACVPAADRPADRPEIDRVWERIAGYEAWPEFEHDGEIEIHAEDTRAIDGQNLTRRVDAGTLVVCEQSFQGEVDIIEVFERIDDDPGWQGIRFEADGTYVAESFRLTFQCGDCHFGSVGG
jgi:hypothetical protein